jgi:hypothetical protein
MGKILGYRALDSKIPSYAQPKEAREKKEGDIMTSYNSVECPCYGTLDEIHKVLITDLKWIGNQVSINGLGFTITKQGFKSHLSEKDYSPATLEEFPHIGIAILTGLEETGFDHNYDGDLPDFFQIVTTGHMPHCLARCVVCGVQLDEEEQKRSACSGCYGETVR